MSTLLVWEWVNSVMLFDNKVTMPGGVWESFEGMLKTKEIGIHVRESESGYSLGKDGI